MTHSDADGTKEERVWSAETKGEERRGKGEERRGGRMRTITLVRAIKEQR